MTKGPCAYRKDNQDGLRLGLRGLEHIHLLLFLPQQASWELFPQIPHWHSEVGEM